MRNIDMNNPETRTTIFKNVFNTDNGRAILDWLDVVYKINTPDINNPNDVYYRLGKQSVINMIRNIIKGD